MFVRKIMQDDVGSMVVSVILGLGLAALFQRACKGDACRVIKAPKMSEVQRHVYQVDADSCYKYTPEVIPCPLSAKPS